MCNIRARWYIIIIIIHVAGQSGELRADLRTKKKENTTSLSPFGDKTEKKIPFCLCVCYHVWS